MSDETRELIRICEELPDHERAEVADFARFLLARHQDGAWERAIDQPPAGGRPKLDRFVRDALAEGTEPLEPERL